MTFVDHFSSLAGEYAKFRPGYPDALFAWLGEIAPARKLVWDCACGNGQASRGLATVFDRVIATDASRAQIAEAANNPKIEYRVALAENSGLYGHLADMVTVAQAVHWLDLDGFYKEVRRVVKPHGVIALWTYDFLTTEDQNIFASVHNFYENVVGPYWPSERDYIKSGYRTLPFPFTDAIEAPAFHMDVSWNLAQMLGYFHSWSATKRYREVKGVDPVAEFEKELAPLWGDANAKKMITFPLFTRVARI